MPRTGIEPVTRGFSVLCSTNWAIWAYKTVNKLLSCGSRIWTYDLRVMSPTSFQTAPSRDMKFRISISSDRKWMEVDSNHRSYRSRFTVCPLWPLGNPSIKLFNSELLESCKPMIGLEPITCWLQISCSANWATSAYAGQNGNWSFLWSGAYRARTYDPLLVRQMLSQLS